MIAPGLTPAAHAYGWFSAGVGFHVGPLSLSFVLGQPFANYGPGYYYRAYAPIAYSGYHCTDRCFVDHGVYYHDRACPVVRHYLAAYQVDPYDLYVQYAPRYGSYYDGGYFERHGGYFYGGGGYDRRYATRGSYDRGYAYRGYYDRGYDNRGYDRREDGRDYGRQGYDRRDLGRQDGRQDTRRQDGGRRDYGRQDRGQDRGGRGNGGQHGQRSDGGHGGPSGQGDHGNHGNHGNHGDHHQ
jgi:hypothetical protein